MLATPVRDSTKPGSSSMADIWHSDLIFVQRKSSIIHLCGLQEVCLDHDLSSQCSICWGWWGFIRVSEPDTAGKQTGNRPRPGEASLMTAERRLLCTASISISANMILFFLLKKASYESVTQLNGDQLEPLCLCSVISVNPAFDTQILHSATSKHTSKDRKERGNSQGAGQFFFFLWRTHKYT